MTSTRSQLVIGYLSAGGKLVASTSSAVCAQALQGSVPDFQLSVSRSLIQCVLNVIGWKIAGRDFEINREHIPGLLYLSVLYIVFNVGYYGAMTHLPLMEVHGVVTIASIVTAFLHSRLVFYIDISKSQILAFFVCVFGILLAAQPPWLFGTVCGNPTLDNVSNFTQQFESSRSYFLVSERAIMFGYIVSVIAGVAEGLMFDVNRITLKSLNPLVKVTYAVFFCAIGSVASMFYLEEPVVQMDETQFLLVLGHGVTAAVNSFCFVTAAHYTPGPTLSAVFSLQMVFMIVSQYTIMHNVQPGSYNWIEVLGCVVIIVGGILPSVVDILAHRAENDELP